MASIINEKIANKSIDVHILNGALPRREYWLKISNISVDKCFTTVHIKNGIFRVNITFLKSYIIVYEMKKEIEKVKMSFYECVFAFSVGK